MWVYTWAITPRVKVGFFVKLNPEILAGLRQYKTDVGVPIAEQIDRALRQWLAERGVLKVRSAHGRSGPATRDVVPTRPRARTRTKRKAR